MIDLSHAPLAPPPQLFTSPPLAHSFANFNAFDMAYFVWTFTCLLTIS